MNVKLKKWQMSILIALILISFSVSVVLLFDINKPAHYNLLFILPLIFALYLLLYAKLLKVFFDNIGVTLILGLLFVRLVICPFFMSLGGYNDKIILNVHLNTSLSILLVAYETIAIMTVLFLLMKSLSSKEKNNEYGKYLFKVNRKYIFIIVMLVLLQIVIFVYTPGLLEGYRSIYNVRDISFTHLEQTHIIQKYSIDFGSKLSLVTGQYLMKVLKLVVPSVIIILINSKRSRFRQILSYFALIPQLFLIEGTIARTIIYILVLFLLIHYIYPYKRIKKIAIILVIASITIISYWIFRLNLVGGNINKYLSTMFNSYFSGVNIVSGSLNLPKNADLRLHYLSYDFLKSIPYGNTLFGLQKGDIQIFFNQINETTGQIPTTIGSGYYYFGFLLSPIYSIIFTIMAFKMGKKANQTLNLISKTRYLYLSIIFPMGIIMYNIQITLTNLISIGLPMYVIEKITYRNKKKAFDYKMSENNNGVIK